MKNSIKFTLPATNRNGGELSLEMKLRFLVKICAQARAVENQIFVATAGTIGNIPSVDNMDINYAQSGIYTPSDFAFPPDAIAGECNTNIETVVIADLDLAALERARNTGTVLNWKDRRLDMYEVLEK